MFAVSAFRGGGDNHDSIVLGNGEGTRASHGRCGPDRTVILLLSFAFALLLNANLAFAIENLPPNVFILG